MASQIHRTEKIKDFTRIDNYGLRDTRLSYKAKGLLAVCLSMNDDWDFSAKGLASLTGDGERSVMTGLRELEDCGYLVRTPVRSGNRIVDWKYEIYEKTKDLMTERDDDSLYCGFVQVQNVQVQNVDVQNEPQLTTITNQQYKESTIEEIKEEKEIHKEKEPTQKRTREKKSDAFEALWSAYPRKQGKQGAYKAYIKALKDGDTFEEMMDGIQRYVAYIEAEGTPMQYVKMGQTFFNGRCWNDEYDMTVRSHNQTRPVFTQQPRRQSTVGYFLDLIESGALREDDEGTVHEDSVYPDDELS